MYLTSKKWKMENNSLNKIMKMLVLLATFSFLSSCDTDDGVSDSNNPEATDFLTEISSAPGLEFKFEGSITDEVGISSINLKYADWFLDKTIELTDTPNEYMLDYKFTVPENVSVGSAHTIPISINDVGGNTTIINVVVSLNLDLTSPNIQFTSPQEFANFNNEGLIPIGIEISDDFELQSLQILSSSLNLNDIVEFNSGETNFSYSSEISIPENISGNVTIEAIVTDQQGNEASTSVQISIGTIEEFTDVYLVGGSTWFDWDPTKATQMWQDPNDDEVFIVEFYYTTGNDVKFIGQLAWSPLNWGLNPENTSEIINSQDSQGINFPDGDGYYRITFNPYELEYTYQKLTIDIAEEEDMYLMGKGFVGYNLDWNPTDAIAMTKDSNNPFVFSVQVEFSNEVDLKFIGQNDGWGPYDAGFEVGGEQQLPINYVKGVTGDGSPDIKFFDQPGSYQIKYDYFLLRTSIQPVD